MTFTPSEERLGIPPIAFTSALNTTIQSGQSPFANVAQPLGTIIRAYDPTFGEGEFIYLLGVANTVTGILVTWDATTYQTTILPSTAALDTPVAVAMSANVAAQTGWYQISGMATVLKTNVNVVPQAGVTKVYISATAGRIFVTSASGKQIMGARTANLATVTTTTSTVVLHISRPFAQGQIT